MSAFKKIGNYFGFGEEGYEQDDAYTPRDRDYDEPAYESGPPEDELMDEPQIDAAVTPIRASMRPVETTPVEPVHRIQTIHPRSYNDAVAIGEAFRAGIPVIINLSAMDDVNSKRLVDFAAGLTFGLHGNLEKVTTAVFLLTPEDYEVANGTEPEREQKGFFNQS
ncbi:cell division protein SepF [Brevibacterium sp. 50QC2O2]|uniref:cell division protein SepF n=1 Tax=Brevibacterium sp. 50QC2O2 TaxID=2968459 RepID=UPI00211C4130|nr:cell division protein SepF [Brevibacterium sp. 50QC2O2]MCQ9388358.1 cell division protein SepF [Brevibacterium sp. 50QC2O2]